MENDSFTEVSSESWFGRLGDSFKSVVVGLILFVVAFPLLFWNEGRAVQTARSLGEGKGALVKPALDKVDAANDSKLIYLSGTATSDETLADTNLNVKEDKALRLVTKAEMFQWVETKKTEKKKKLGGGQDTITTYSYEKKWEDKAIDSSQFKKAAEHSNPTSMPKGQDILAKKPMLGAYQLSEALVRSISKQEKVPITAVPRNAPPSAKAVDGSIFVGDDSTNPKVGDKRMTVFVVRSQPVSVIAGQGAGGVLQPYQTKAGDPISMLQEGQVSSDSMFQKAQDANSTLTWILRLVGFVVMFAGLCMMASPLTTMADVIPFVGDLLGMGVALFAFPVALLLSLGTISIAWIAYRPLVALGLIAAGVAVFFVVKAMMGGRRAAA